MNRMPMIPNHKAIFAISILLVCACACDVPTSRGDLAVFGEMHLTTSTVDELFEGGADINLTYNADGADVIDLYCHITEGPWCYYVEAGLLELSYSENVDAMSQHSIEREFSKRLVTELHPKFIEQSKGNGVKVRCQRNPSSEDVTCSVDRGGGMEAVPIR